MFKIKQTCPYCGFEFENDNPERRNLTCPGPGEGKRKSCNFLIVKPLIDITDVTLSKGKFGLQLQIKELNKTLLFPNWEKLQERLDELEKSLNTNEELNKHTTELVKLKKEKRRILEEKKWNKKK